MDGDSNSRSEYQSIAAQFAAAKAAAAKKDFIKKQTQSQEIPVDLQEQKRRASFTSLHLTTLGFFSWIFLLHVLGIYFFARGFLLTRLVLNHKSECASPSLAIPHYEQGSYSTGCWYPKTFDKAIIVIVDALRYDFTVPFREQPRHYHNALTVFHEVAVDTPHKAFLLPFIADPPTTTLQRLKGLTTGTLPTFIDAGSNFAGTAIEEDNLIAQLREANRTLVHLGDDTWHSLFPGYFDANLTRSYDSFNVWDLFTVDNGVTEHLFPLLEPANVGKWDVIVGHYLGVDHAGHRYGPDHPAMAGKLREMDEVFRRLVKSLDDQTLLVVMGDHGMDSKGDHGGESDDEVEAALWMYSNKGIFGRSLAEYAIPPATAKIRPVEQIDLVPTLSLLLGLPIPFNNLGAPIEEAFIGRDGQQWSNLAAVNALTGAQIQSYQCEYAVARGFEASTTSGPQLLLDKALILWERATSSKTADLTPIRSASQAFSDYQRETLNLCRSLWARFDITSMLVGIGILCLTLFAVLAYTKFSSGEYTNILPTLLFRIASFSVPGILAGGAAGFLISSENILDFVLLGFVGGSLLGCFSTLLSKMTRLIPIPSSLWSSIALLFTVLQAIGFASNSYTIWEDEMLLFFLATFASVAVCSSLRQATLNDRVLGLSQSFTFLGLTRLASLSRLCREEQMPFCRSTYYSSANSSTSATWQLLIPFVIALILPAIIKSYYEGTRSFEGSAIFWLGFAFRMGLLGSAILWAIDAADNGKWTSFDENVLHTMRIVIAQVVLAVAFGVGVTTYIWARPCVRLDKISGLERPLETTAKPRAVIILGYANVHGSRYFLLLSCWVLAIALLQKPMGAGAVALLSWQILALLEIIDTNDLSQSSVGPVILGLLGNYYFFKTGHQATLSSIQWDTAFIAFKNIVYPWSPLLVVLNTFGSQMLTAIAVPLLVLWKQPPKKTGLLGDVSKAMMNYILYHAFINLTTTMWAGWLRRHLMLYRIFSPRFLTGAAVLVITDIAGILVALGGFRWNMIGNAEVFGWH